MDMSPREVVKEVCALQAFGPVLDSIRAEDGATAENIENALRAALGELPAIMAKGTAGKFELLYAVKDAQLRLVEYRSHYQTIGEQLARQKSYFLGTAMDTVNAFFDDVYGGLDAYFSGVTEQVSKILQEHSAWWTGLQDTWRKTGGKFINASKKAGHKAMRSATDPERLDGVLHRAGNALGERGKQLLGKVKDAAGKLHTQLTQADAEAAWLEERTLLEQALERVCPTGDIEKNVARVFEQASARYQATWKARVATYHEELARWDSAARGVAGALHVTPTFSVGAAEQTLAASLGATIFGTAALAAGWHTLAYAMASVFWPLTAFVMLMTAGVAWLTKDKAMAQRETEAQKILNAYHGQLLMYIDTHPLAEHGGKSVRQLVNEQSAAIATALDASWTEARFGRVTPQRYAGLVQAIEQQIALLRQCEDSL
jgi:hypothetical protein